MSFGCVYMGGLLLPSESVCAQCELALLSSKSQLEWGHRALCPCALSCLVARPPDPETLSLVYVVV